MRALTAQALADAVERLGLPAPLRFVDSTPSTMTDARALARDGAPHGAAIVAGHQTAGRGRLDRSWVAPRGSVAMTAVLRPALGVSEVGLVSLAAAVAVREACGERYGIKWPNDILGPDDRKVAGILCEVETAGRTVDFVLVGVGINVFSAPSDVPNAGCLADYDPRQRDIASVAARVASALIESVRLAERDPGALLASWRSGAATIGRRVVVAGATGIATGITTSGGLIVQTDDGAAIVAHSGDVEHVPR